ncbi:MAG: MFS transporter [Streptosporangiaceae bacterium]
MCAACGVATHVPVLDADPAARPEAVPGQPLAQPAKFAALRNPACRVYLCGGALAMMADNIEHVITYWVIWQRFHSPALTGFEVISHWLPFLLLSPYFGALADRYDCRKLIQGSQALPLTFVAARTKYTGHTRYGLVARERVGALAAVKVFREVSRDRVLAAMIILAGLGSFFIGSAMQTVMPTIANTTSGLSSGTAYGVLLFANGLGGVLGGLLLEGTGWIRLSVRAALWSSLVYGAATVLFAINHDYLVAAPLLVVGGIANLAVMSISQTVTQLRAPRGKKGQVVGVYSTSANGMRIGSGFTVGLLGAVIGLRPALALSSAALCACVLALAVYLAAAARRSPAEPADGSAA